MNLESHARWSSSVGTTRPESLTRTSSEVVSSSESADADEPAPRNDEPTTKLAPGSVIPSTRLEIVRWLGEGGMGTVFEVRHLDIDRHFAAKLLHRSESVARARRFRREAKTIGNIGSPWVVEIFDFKELPDGRLMYLMELVDGPTLLAGQAQTGALELPRLIGLARQICKGLSDAHARGFIHRDIKPENIMLATDADGREHVKIVDFGLAGLLAQPNESSRAGTPTYMSPEQCKGEPADARADIYALGVTLYELATGTLPFCRDTAEALRHDHVRRQPRPPSMAPGAPELPESFDALILRCMAKQPEDRFANAAEVEAALIELQIELRLRTAWDDLPVPDVHDPRRATLEQGLARLRRDRERERSRRTLIGVVLASLVVASSALGWYAGAQARADAIVQAEADIEQLRAEIRAAIQARRWVYPPAAQPDAATAYALLLELEALQLDRADEVGLELREEIAEQLLAYADAYWDTPGGRSFAREFYAHVLVFDPDHPRALERAGLSSSAAASLRERAATKQFDQVELEALAVLVALVEPDRRQRLEALLALHANADELPASVAVSLDQMIDDLEQQLPEVVASRKPAAGSAPTAVTPEPEAHEPASSPEPEPPKPVAAKPEASELEPSTAEQPRNRADASKLAEAAEAAFAAGRRTEAERLFQRTLEIDGNNLTALAGLHRLHFDRGEFKDALAYAKRAVALRPKRADLHIDVGDSCMKVLDYGCARSHYEQAQELGAEQAGKRLRMLGERLGDESGAAEQ